MKFWKIIVLMIFCTSIDIGFTLPCGNNGEVSIDQQQQATNERPKPPPSAANTIACVQPWCSPTRYCRTETDKQRCEAEGKICYTNGTCGDLVLEETL